MLSKNYKKTKKYIVYVVIMVVFGAGFGDPAPQMKKIIIKDNILPNI